MARQRPSYRLSVPSRCGTVSRRMHFLPDTAFVFQYRRHGSRHTPVFTWRPRISGRRSSGMERVTAQCHLRAVSVFISATSENFSVSATTARVTLINVSWSWSARTQHHVNPGELNWTELNWILVFLNPTGYTKFQRKPCQQRH